MRYELSDLKAAAYGRWPEIHAALGIPAHLLNTRKHQPCPYCGGRDRYRYTDHQHSGGFICNQCTPQGGSGFDLLMLVFGYDFKQAAHEVAVLLGMAAPDTRPSERPAPRLPPPKAEPIHDKQPALLKTWHEAQPLNGLDPASLYLHTRGLLADTWQHTGGAIRHHAALPLYALRADDSHTTAPLLLGYFPAMIAAICDTGGQLQGLHLTYLAANGNNPHRWHKLAAAHPETHEPLPSKKMRARYPNALHGAAVQMGKPDTQGRLIVAEGIETALAARAMFDLPAASALSANGLSCYQWPPGTQTLFIVADNDTSQTGQRAAESLARRAVSDGLKAAVWTPPAIGHDALDDWNARQTAKAKAV